MAEEFIIGRTRMAQIACVSVNGLIKLEGRGLPVRKKKQGGHVYSLPAVVKWLKLDEERKRVQGGNSAPSTALHLRRVEADTRKAELEVAKLEASVLPVDLLQKGLEGLMVHQRVLLLGLPSQIGREIDQPELRVRIVAMAERTVRDVLAMLESYDPTLDELSEAGAGHESDGDDSRGSPSHQSAAENHDQSVGRTKSLPQPRRRRVRAVAQ